MQTALLSWLYVFLSFKKVEILIDIIGTDAIIALSFRQAMKYLNATDVSRILTLNDPWLGFAASTGTNGV